MAKSLLEDSGVSSAKNAWGQWASFSLGIGKLKGYSGKTPTFKQPFISGSKEETDWMTVASKVMEGANGALDAYEADQEKEVDKYLQSHSKEEYMEAIKNRGLPFQNDPIAMKVFKGKYANIYAGMAYEEFQARLESGEFDGLSEAQVDAEFFKHMRDAKERIASDTNGEFAGKTFDEAFFLDSPKKRALIMASQAKRTRDIKVQQDQIANDALFQTAVGDGTIRDSDSFLAFSKGIYETTGRHFTPKEWSTQLGSWLKSLANTPNGIETLKGLKGKEIPFMGGLKFDDDDLEVHISNAVKSKAESDASAWYSLTQQISDLEAKGDIRTLQSMLVASNKKYSNEKNDESTFINNAILRIKKKQQETIASNYAGVKGAKQAVVKFTLGNTYITKLGRGETPTGDDVRALVLNGVDMSQVVLKRFELGLETPQTIVAMANNPAMFIGGNNPYLTLIKKQADSAINALASYDNPQKPLPSNEEISKVFADVASFYEADPAVFMKACATGKESTNLEKLDAIFIARNAGLNMQSILDANRNLKMLEKSGKLKEKGYKKIQDLEDAINARTEFPLDGYSKALQLLGASHMINHLGSDIDTALSCSENVFMKAHTKIGNAYVPRLFINTATQTNTDMALLNELIQQDVSKYAKSQGYRVGQYRYNSALQCLEVFDDESTIKPLKTYGIEEIRNLYLEEKRTKFVESEGWTEKPIKELQAVKKLQKYRNP